MSTAVEAPVYTIWKTALVGTDYQQIEVPKGSEFLCARDQQNQLCVWYRCDPNAEMEKRRIIIVGTGLGTPPKELARYLGTGFIDNGLYVFHIFEVMVSGSAAEH